MSQPAMGNGANPNKRTIYVCQNEFCLNDGAEGYVEKLRQKVAHRAVHLAGGNSSSVESEPDVTVRPYICFNACSYGPIMLLYPDCQWYAGVTAEDLDTIVNAAFSSQPQGPEIERLQDNALNIDPDVRDAALFALKREMR